MQQLSLWWMTLEPRQRALSAGGAAALAITLFMLIRLVSAPGMSLLYSGLEPAAAGDVVAALQARGVAHEVRGEGIYVDQALRDELRMELAGDGLPANGAAGYELLDVLPGFGTTAQMFDAAYWRAKEGELARTILSSPMVRAARVHIASVSTDPFSDREEVTASVTLRPATGGITDGFAHAIRFMVASSVPGLQPGNVAVIDAESGRVIGEGMAEMGTGSGAAEARADMLRRNIERLLSARVGPENAIVEVSVDLVTSRETILERRIDPDSRVLIASDSEEQSDSASNSTSGAVTVSSNLPTGDGDTAGSGSSSQTTETRERISYDISEIQREVESQPGDVRRISVAVLVNGATVVGADGRETVEPRSEAELEVLEALIRSAIGFDAERGDQVTIRSMAFEVPPESGTTGDGGLGWANALDVTALIKFALLATVALAAIFGAIRPALRAGPQALPAPAGAELPARGLPAVAAPEIDASGAPDAVPDLPALADLPPIAAGAPPAWDGEIVTSEPLLEPPRAESPVERLRRLIEEREAETVEILRSWMEDDEESTP